jgi:mannose/fructose/N-acetylgalactosamine-specific phosphotransferase system component IID
LWWAGGTSPFLVAFLGAPRGYAQGSAFVLTLPKVGALQRLSLAVGIAFMFIMGGTAAKFLGMGPSSPSTPSTLDNVLPGIFSMGAVFTLCGLQSGKFSPFCRQL